MTTAVVATYKDAWTIRNVRDDWPSRTVRLKEERCPGAFLTSDLQCVLQQCPTDAPASKLGVDGDRPHLVFVYDQPANERPNDLPA